MLVQHIFEPYTTSNENFLTASLSLLWLLDLMVSCSMTFALYLAIALESTDFNTTQTWVAIFKKTRHMFVVLISTFCEL